MISRTNRFVIVALGLTALCGCGGMDTPSQATQGNALHGTASRPVAVVSPGPRVAPPSSVVPPPVAATASAPAPGAKTGTAASAAPVTALAAHATLDCASLDADGEPTELGCTGLYSDWASSVVAPNVIPYTPGYELWSDGAEKGRYLWLPAGSKVDTSDMDEWTFPVGTKVWKEFSLAGRLVETRFMTKRTDGSWFRTAYRWADDGSDAIELTAGALIPNPTDTMGQAMYEIPTGDDCETCHLGRIDNVLGFEAMTLSAPGSLVRGAAPGSSLAGIADLISDPPAAPLAIPGDATAQAALGWLHANCGIACHSASPSANANPTGLHMRLVVAGLASVEATDTYVTAVNQASRIYNPPSANPLSHPEAPTILLKAGDPGGSLVPYRDGTRDPIPFVGEPNQMPPLVSHLVDDAGVAAVRAWIGSVH